MKSHQYIWQNPKWPDFTWDSSKILEPLGKSRMAQGKLLESIKGLGLELLVSAHAEILTEEAIKTSSIEGEHINHASVRSSVARKLGLPTAGLPADRNAEGLVSVLIDATTKCNDALDAERLFGWHAALFPTGYSGLHKIKTGAWRKTDPMRIVSGPVGKEKVHYIAPDSKLLDSEMNRYFTWWKNSREKMEGILRAATAQFYFVCIHPFDDGNGRIARALSDMALAQDDGQTYRYYSMSSQIEAERQHYYEILGKCSSGLLDITPWIVWFTGCFERSVKRSENILSIVLKKSSFWKKHHEADITQRQKKALNKLLDAGPGGFEGGITTRKYASITGVSKPTAFRELSRLYELGLLKQSGKGRSVRYDIDWD